MFSLSRGRGIRCSFIYPVPLHMMPLGSCFNFGRSKLCFSQKPFEFISPWRSLAPPQILKKLWVFCLHVLIWSIWKERNWRVFENSTGDLSSVSESFLFLVSSWFKCDQSLSSYSFVTFRCNFQSSFLMRKTPDFY